MDFPSTRRQEVIDYISTIEGIDFAEIITFNTIATKGAIRDVGRALGIPLNVVSDISKSIDSNTVGRYRESHKELFEYVDLLEGTVVSMGSHPSGFVVSPIDLCSNVSTLYTKESRYKVTAVNMKELDGENYVKLDVLGLDNVELINETCKLANIERLTPDNINTKDMDVWKSLQESTLGVFQFESETGFDYIQTLFSEGTLSKITDNVGEVNYINLLSMANGAIRPAGESYRNFLANGNVKDNGHESLNQLLESNLGQMIFQEDIMKFLTDFCNHTGSESDSVRRGLAKKSGTEQFLPKIREGFLAHMNEEYGENTGMYEEILESFLKVIEDASDYGFSLNHSQPYSYIGYAGAYLRYHYPYEFITTLLNIREDKMDKSAKVVEFARSKNIDILPIKFGKSKSQYMYSKEDEAIYKGMKSIKYINDEISEQLYNLAQEKEYNSFVDLLIDIVEETKVNARQLNILIRLGFFEELGGSKTLEVIAEKFNDRYKKTHKEPTKLKRLEEIRQFADELEDVGSYHISEDVMFEKENLGYAQSTDEKYDKSYAVIMNIDTKFSPNVKIYLVNNGIEFDLRVQKSIFYDDNKNPLLKDGDMIKVLKIDKKPKMQKSEGKWIPTDVMQFWLTSWQTVDIIQ